MSRWQKKHTGNILRVLVLIGLGGCTEPWLVPPSSPQEDGSSGQLTILFHPEPEDKKYFQVIAREQDKNLSQCTEEAHCVRAHFLRALTAMYESPELAKHHFQKVIATEPDSPLAHDSRLWLWLLEEAHSTNGHQTSARHVAKRLVRELVAREISLLEQSEKEDPALFEAVNQELTNQDKKVKEIAQQMNKLSRQIDSLKGETASIQAVRQELKARNKKVDELTNQLEALRRIDQELREKAPPTRPSDKILPPVEEEKSANP